MTEAQKAWIDGASYEQLLRRWRFAPNNDPMFLVNSQVFDYYKRKLAEKKAKIGSHEATSISNKIGWRL